MSDYLDENLLIRGKVEAKRGKRISEIEGEYYLRPTKEIKVLDEYWEGGTIK
ncbi:MAG: hypothetical protein HY886_04330 [Deltaproteobacteria bacterium]|nr:hypothetical protein [Deltaproteobacteria bacterium]